MQAVDQNTHPLQVDLDVIGLKEFTGGVTADGASAQTAPVPPSECSAPVSASATQKSVKTLCYK